MVPSGFFHTPAPAADTPAHHRHTRLFPSAASSTTAIPVPGMCVCRFTRKAHENGISLSQVFLYPSNWLSLCTLSLSHTVYRGVPGWSVSGLMIGKDVKENGCGLILATSPEFPLLNLRKKNIEGSPPTSWYLTPGRPEFAAGCLLITRLWFVIGWNMKTV